MPVKRRIPKLRKTDWEGVAPGALSWLRGDNSLWEFADVSQDFDLEVFYREHSERLIAEFIVDNPGRRPGPWWRFMAPEPRRRLGGRGDLQRGYSATYELGIPRAGDWAFEALDPRYFAGERPVPVDPLDPPRFESQAAYLKRLRLLIPGEAVRLSEADFAPHVVASCER